MALCVESQGVNNYPPHHQDQELSLLYVYSLIHINLYQYFHVCSIYLMFLALHLKSLSIFMWREKIEIERLNI